MVVSALDEIPNGIGTALHYISGAKFTSAILFHFQKEYLVSPGGVSGELSRLPCPTGDSLAKGLRRAAHLGGFPSGGV